MVRLIYKIAVTFSIILLGILSANAQCACTNCPQDLPDNTNADFFINVTDDGSAACDLSANPLVGVSLNFTHEYLGDLTIFLTSPSGQTIELVGPEGYFGTTHFMCGFLNQFECPDVWDMNFSDGAPTWDSNILSQNATANNSGTYSASDGNLLSSFTGDACGTWLITVNDGQAFDTGEFIDFGLTFGDNAGMECTSEVPLPIEIVDLYGKIEGRTNVIKWTTLSETNNDYFNIQHSVDGMEFSNVGVLKGAGTTFQLTDYNFVDSQPAPGTSYYRLEQIDFDGTSSYSPIVSITRDKDEYSIDAISLSPSPVISQTTLVISSTIKEKTIVEVRDINGRIQETFTVDVEIGGNFIQMDGSNWSNGIYFLRTRSASQKHTMKFIKM